MRLVVQRVTRAKVTVAGEIVGEIGRGYLALAGVEEGDTDEDMRYGVEKLVGRRDSVGLPVHTAGRRAAWPQAQLFKCRKAGDCRPDDRPDGGGNC